MNRVLMRRSEKTAFPDVVPFENPDRCCFHCSKIKLQGCSVPCRSLYFSADLPFQVVFFQSIFGEMGEMHQYGPIHRLIYCAINQQKLLEFQRFFSFFCTNQLKYSQNYLFIPFLEIRYTTPFSVPFLYNWLILFHLAKNKSL